MKMIKVKKWGLVLAGILLCIITLAFCFNGTPLAVSAADTQKSTESETPSIQPRFGGVVERTVDLIPNEYDFTYYINANNFIFPATDEAYVRLTSNSKHFYIRLKINFCWINSSNKVTNEAVFVMPADYDKKPDSYEATSYRDSRSIGEWWVYCDDLKKVVGKPGTKWACAYIDVSMSVKCENAAGEVIATASASERVWF